MRIVGYARLSRASREESTSIVRQRELIEKTCEVRGMQLVETVVDDNVSAARSRFNRPALSKVRQMIRDGEADAVMAWRLDRLVRSVVDVGVLLDEGLQIISATESLDTTSPMGRAMVEILQVFASMEAKTIGPPRLGDAPSAPPTPTACSAETITAWRTCKRCAAGTTDRRPHARPPTPGGTGRPAVASRSSIRDLSYLGVPPPHPCPGTHFGIAPPCARGFEILGLLRLNMAHHPTHRIERESK
jgi:hypothetical protein